MSIWINANTTVDDSIADLYVIDEVGIIDSTRFILLIDIKDCPSTRLCTLVTNKKDTDKDISKFSTIFSPVRLTNVTAWVINLIPHKGKLWFRYVSSRYETDDFTYCVQIFNTDNFYHLYSSQLFSNLMKILLIGRLSTDTIRYVMNLGCVK